MRCLGGLWFIPLCLICSNSMYICIAQEVATFAAFEALGLEEAVPSEQVIDSDANTVTFALPPLVAGRQYGVVLDFNNEMLRPLKVKDVVVSCGCIKAFVSSRKHESGEVFPSRLAFTAPDGDVAFQKRMVLDLENGPPVYLVIKGTAVLPYRISPRRLDLANLKLGQDVEFLFRRNESVKFAPAETNFGLRSDFLKEKGSRVAKDGAVTLVASVSSIPTKRSVAFAGFKSSSGDFEKQILLSNDSDISVIPRFIDLSSTREIMLLGSLNAIESLSGKSLEVIDADGDLIGMLEPRAGGKRLLRYEIILSGVPSSIGDVGFIREIGFKKSVVSVRFVAD